MDFFKLGAEILGESFSESEIIERYKLWLDEDELIDYLLSVGVEYCDYCGTWKETAEMADEQERICLECNEHIE